MYEVFDVEGIMSQDMVWYRLCKIAKQRICMVEHAYLTQTL
jgi:hypothetical protein